MRFTKTLAVLTATAMAAGMAVMGSGPAVADHGYSHAPAFYLIPHQDDDVLSMGADMKIHVQEAKRPTYAVLLTDGSESGVCYWRYGEGTSDVEGQRRRGVLSQAERDQCSQVRDEEFKLAMNRLGVTPIIRSDRKQEGCATTYDKFGDPFKNPDCTEQNELKRAYVLDVIQEILAEYPNASFKGYTYKESLHCTGCGYNNSTGTGHADHDVIGEALRYAYNQGWTDDIRFFVKPSMWHRWPNIDGGWAARGINHVLDAYGEDSPLAPNNGIGHASVETMFCEQYDAVNGAPSYCSQSQLERYTDEPGEPSSVGGSHNRIHYPGE